MSDRNLLSETVQFLAERGKSSDDVLWVGFGKKFHCTWGEFVAAAAFSYDSGFGGAEVDQCLKVVGADWWLERGEYDGSEWWEFKTLPTKANLMQRTPTEDDLKERW